LIIEDVASKVKKLDNFIMLQINDPIASLVHQQIEQSLARVGRHGHRQKSSLRTAAARAHSHTPSQQTGNFS
jgi:hypothetical protein